MAPGLTARLSSGPMTRFPVRAFARRRPAAGHPRFMPSWRKSPMTRGLYIAVVAPFPFRSHPDVIGRGTGGAIAHGGRRMLCHIMMIVLGFHARKCKKEPCAEKRHKNKFTHRSVFGELSQIHARPNILYRGKTAKFVSKTIFMKHSGSADLPLHNGYVPAWLAERMARLGLAVTEVLLTEFGKEEVLRRLSDPFWFQSLGAVMGMDRHSARDEPGQFDGEAVSLAFCRPPFFCRGASYRHLWREPGGNPQPGRQASRSRTFCGPFIDTGEAGDDDARHSTTGVAGTS